MRVDHQAWDTGISRQPIITQRLRSAKMGREQFSKWLQASRPNDRFVYHVGDLQADRTSYLQLHWLGLDALQAYYRGDVVLMQYRRGPFRYEYTAIRIAS